MSKASRKRRKDIRQRIKSARRAARSALYKSFAEQGRVKQSKRQRKKKQGVSTRLLFRVRNRNRRRTWDVEITLPNGETRTVRRGGTMPRKAVKRMLRRAREGYKT